MAFVQHYHDEVSQAMQVLSTCTLIPMGLSHLCAKSLSLTLVPNQVKPMFTSFDCYCYTASKSALDIACASGLRATCIVLALVDPFLNCG